MILAETRLAFFQEGRKPLDRVRTGLGDGRAQAFGKEPVRLGHVLDPGNALYHDVIRQRGILGDLAGKLIGQRQGFTLAHRIMRQTQLQ